MKTTRPGLLVLTLVIAAAIGWIGTLLTTAYRLPVPVLGIAAVITLTAVAALLMVLGIRVLRDRKKPPAARMNPLAAARTVVLAQATAYTGMVIAGWHIGILIDRIPAAGIGSQTTVDAMMMVVTGAAVTVIGLVVEQWCKIPPDDESDDRSDPPPRSPGLPQAGRNLP
ncbi:MULTISPECIES: DUF3180 domain-containing protein [Auritidibacter]|uniref:DUF3180 domain-containing protein n=1 Tax=Auritidibacter ignavus TaxID=678932 RepID=A0AAJ6ALP5_9MICC|nr:MULTISPECIES: DUF3180 domain-containing protein [Auritidibacter]AXR74361.1 DUF3180 domain-containing protein [Auritidibacter sp. NML130574]NIH72581.1 hypothetical protein [Auritidibacter ignavus]PXA76572.1 DUF3180 domain-containing protein [Auritidibacter sp. NML100628]PXA79037.1 DUF3180 domain-containing protein [Auritidibacter sp. NML120636]RMX22613.1 DUF3180 domain-containing protein [Auritidibacter ignavus]